MPELVPYNSPGESVVVASVEHVSAQEAVSRRSPFTHRGARIAATLSLVAGGVFVGHEIADRENDQILQAQQDQRAAIENLAGVTGAFAGVSPETVLGENLVSAKDLPGYGKEVSPQLADELKAAPVQVVSRYKYRGEGAAPYWDAVCSGAKVRYAGADYVMTASHCFDVQHAPYGAAAGALETADIAENSRYEYGVVRPVRGEVADMIVGPNIATDISYRFYQDDFALLKVDSEAGDSFSVVPSVDATRLISSEPIPGEAVSMFGLPGVGEGKLMEGDGVYLGTVSGAIDDSSAVHDVVGVKNADDKESDICNPGTSGSLAVTAGGYLLGPAHYRQNLGYGHDAKSFLEGSSQVDEGDYYKKILRYEDELGVRLRGGEFNTLCLYSQPDSSTLPALIEGLDVQYPSPENTVGQK